jgi:hypothetical protein
VSDEAPHGPYTSALLVAVIALLAAIAIVISTKVPVAVRAPVTLVSDLPADDTLMKAGIRDWHVGELPAHMFAAHRISVLPRVPAVVISGWAYDEPMRPGDTLVGIVDGMAYAHAEWGSSGAGYRIILDTGKLAPGRHTLQIAVASPEAGALHRGPSVQFIIR